MADSMDSALPRPAYHGIARRAWFFLALAFLWPASALAHSPSSEPATAALSPPAQRGMELMYNGDPDAAITVFRQMERTQPKDPLGYLLEGEARWWKIYCQSLQVKWGMVDAWERPKLPGDREYFSLADEAIRLAERRGKRNDTAEMHLYAGLGWALKARLYGLRDETHATAHAGVEARKEFIQALKLDPALADADTGLGLYNYYIDTLSAFVKILRFFMGIPGGSKKDGIRQLTRGMKYGELTSIEARFYLAKNLRTYDYRYEQALVLIEPLVEKYPQNPIFLLLRGNLYAELGRTGLADADFRAAEKLQIADPACAARVDKIADEFLSARPPS